MSVKKFLKWLTIVVLILACVLLTCFWFFKFVERRTDSTKAMALVIENEPKTKFEQELNSLNTNLQLQGDSRFATLVKTNNNLNAIVANLFEYLEGHDGLRDNDITKLANSLDDNRKIANKMFDEYNLKIESAYFVKTQGANDLFCQVSTYLKNYAEFAKLLNSEISKVGINVSSDIKFSMFEAYSDVVILSVGKVNTSSSLVQFNDATNLTFFNNYFTLRNGRLANANNYILNNNSFIKYYQACDKNEFANYLRQKCVLVTGTGNSNVDMAIYYFKLIYGV